MGLTLVLNEWMTRCLDLDGLQLVCSDFACFVDHADDCGREGWTLADQSEKRFWELGKGLIRMTRTSGPGLVIPSHKEAFGAGQLRQQSCTLLDRHSDFIIIKSVEEGRPPPLGPRKGPALAHGCYLASERKGGQSSLAQFGAL